MNLNFSLPKKYSIVEGDFEIFKVYFADYAITVVPFFSPFYSPPLCIPIPPAFPYLSSCPWFIHISSLASPFPILCLTSPSLFWIYHLCFLFLLPFPPLSPLPLLTGNIPCDLHFCESVPILVVCLVHFCFWFWFCFQVRLLIVVSLLSFYSS